MRLVHIRGALVAFLAVSAFYLWHIQRRSDGDADFSSIDADTASEQFEKTDLYDERLDEDVTPSTDLEGDLAKMWRLTGLETRDDTGDVTYLASPVSAINAASRVIEAEKDKLVGLESKAILARLKFDEGYRKGSYCFPFHPLGRDERAMVLRFDCGMFGWQFDFLVGEDGKVRDVRRQWIH